MKQNHPNNILDFIPGGCTSIAQPCDVGMQRPFKHSIKRSYHEDIVVDVMAQLKADEDIVTIDTRLPVLRDQSTHWLWNAYQTANKEALVKKVVYFCPRETKYSQSLIGLREMRGARMEPIVRFLDRSRREVPLKGIEDL